MAEQRTRVLRRAKNKRKTERRAWVRFQSEQDVACYTEEAIIGWLGIVRDVSPAGIGLSVSRRFEPGTALTVEQSERPRVLRHLLVHVVHATPEANGLWIIGCTFDCALSAQELQTFLAEDCE